MSVIEAPKESFRLSQLIYDTRYRSITIQVVTAFLIVAVLAWLYLNLMVNLSQLGQEPNFGFLGTRAGYDIGTTLIPYDSSSTHGRAAMVGIMNTLLVAFLGCVTALVIGVLVGVLRLSKNWVVSRLMAVYVEGFRNVPLVLWIFLIFAIFVEGMDPPNTFKPNADGVAENDMFLGLIAVTNQGTFLPGPTWANGSWIFAVIVVASIVGIVLWRKHAVRTLYDTGRIVPVALPSLAIFLVPLVVGYIVLSFISMRTEYTFLAVGGEPGASVVQFAEANGRIDYCGIPSDVGATNGRRLLEEANVDLRRREYFGAADSMSAVVRGDCVLLAVPVSDAENILETIKASAGFNKPIAVLTDTFPQGRAVELTFAKMTERGIPRFEGGIQIGNPLVALWLALSLYTGAFIAEIVRAGILSVSKGQSEAAFALGMQPNRTMSLVILPQAMRVIIPPLISQFLNLTKNSSLAIAVGYPDIRATLGGITLNQTGRALECMLLLGLFYLALSLAISFVMNLYNNSMKLKER